MVQGRREPLRARPIGKVPRSVPDPRARLNKTPGRNAALLEPRCGGRDFADDVVQGGGRGAMGERMIRDGMPSPDQRAEMAGPEVKTTADRARRDRELCAEAKAFEQPRKYQVGERCVVQAERHHSGKHGRLEAFEVTNDISSGAR